MKHRNAGEIVTLEEFDKWMLNCKVNDVHMRAREVYFAIQSRIWVCPVCKEEGFEHRIECSLDETITIGNPICPEGYNMELLEYDNKPVEEE